MTSRVSLIRLWNRVAAYRRVAWEEVKDNKGKVLLLMTWGGTLLLGHLIIQWRQAETPIMPISGDWQVTSNLPVNFRLGKDDLKWPGATGGVSILPTELQGRFLRRDVSAGEAVSSKDVSLAPEFVPVPGHLPFVFDIKQHAPLEQVLNTGSVIDIWCEMDQVLQNVFVQGIICSGKPNEDCFLVLDVAEVDAHKLKALDPKHLRPIVRRIRAR
jgi:hypothetical protein